MNDILYQSAVDTARQQIEQSGLQETTRKLAERLLGIVPLEHGWMFVPRERFLKMMESADYQAARLHLSTMRRAGILDFGDKKEFIYIGFRSWDVLWPAIEAEQKAEEAKRRAEFAARQAERKEWELLARKQPKRPSLPGYVYLLHGENTAWYKIGISRSPDRRLKALNTKAPFRCVMLRAIRVTDMLSAERALHEAFAHKRVEGEWFVLDQPDVDWLLETTATTAEEFQAEAQHMMLGDGAR